MKRINKSIFLISAILIVAPASAKDVWRGLKVEPEFRCSPYDKKTQYPYPQSVEDKLVAKMGWVVYGPYSGRYFDSDTQTDIEHIVATSEGHDSGLCSASRQKRIDFATDLLNLTLAEPKVNRCGAGGKCGLDAGEWLPDKNKCWFTNEVLLVKTKYTLSVDRKEADSLESVLSKCDTFDMIYFPRKVVTTHIENKVITNEQTDALALYDDNGNGRITCSEARSHNITPVRRDDIAYDFMNDKDGDGTVCE